MSIENWSTPFWLPQHCLNMHAIAVWNSATMEIKAWPIYDPRSAVTLEIKLAY